VTPAQREAIREVHGVTHRTLRNWTREHLRCLQDASAELRPPGRPRRLESERAAALEAVGVVLKQLGMAVGEATVHRELGGEVPLRLVRECLATLKAEHETRTRRVRDEIRTHGRVRATGAIWSLDGTHLGRDEQEAKVVGELVRDVASTKTLGASIGPPPTSAEVAALLERAAEDTGQVPLVLAHDNGSENADEVAAWCERHDVIRLRNLPHTPQHNPWVEHGNAEIKAETGLGKRARIASVSGVVLAVERALDRIDGLRPRPTRDWRTARQAYAELPSAERLVDRARFAAAARCAIQEAVQDCRTARQRRLAERQAILATLERFQLITRNRGRAPCRTANAEHVL
jgi:hypothetical protein